MPLLSAPPPGRDRILGLDLARAVAIAMVAIDHMSGHFAAWFGYRDLSPMWDFAGDTGVELFFALSGFLIGRILLDILDRRPGWRDFAVFLTRRAMRTLPLYFLWLAVLLGLFPPADGVAATGPRYATLTQNLIAPMPADNFFAVTWSLAVEEWFYLLFGFAAIFLGRRFGRTRGLAIGLALFLLAPVVFRLACEDWRGLVPFRLDEIAYGVLLAVLHRSASPLFRHPWLSLAGGLALIGFAAAGMPPLPAAWYALSVCEVSVIGCALCLPAALMLRDAPAWFAGPVRWLGTRSYAIYIVHVTVLADIVGKPLAETGLLPLPLCVALAIALPAGLAELSWRFLETPILRLRPRQDAAARTGHSVLPAGIVSAPG